MTTQICSSHQAIVSRNLLLQTISYLEQHNDAMSRMLREQMRYALEQAQEDVE